MVTWYSVCDSPHPPHDPLHKPTCIATHHIATHHNTIYKTHLTTTQVLHYTDPSLQTYQPAMTINQPKPYQSRKFVIFVAIFATSTGLLLNLSITGEQWVDVLIWSYAIYAGGNVGGKLSNKMEKVK